MDMIDSVKNKIKTEIMNVEERTDLSDGQKRSQIIHIFSDLAHSTLKPAFSPVSALI